jgi:hypothetical protein
MSLYIYQYEFTDNMRFDLVQFTILNVLGLF